MGKNGGNRNNTEKIAKLSLLSYKLLYDVIVSGFCEAISCFQINSPLKVTGDCFERKNATLAMTFVR